MKTLKEYYMWALLWFAIFAAGAFTGVFIAHQDIFSACARDGVVHLRGGGTIFCKIDTKVSK